MKRYLCPFVLLILVLCMNGCIISTYPVDENVSMNVGDTLTFQVRVYPSSAFIQWDLDGEPIPEETGTTYTYAPGTEDVGQHEITVNDLSGSDSFTWNVQVTDVWAMVASGWFHTLAIKTDGTLWAWGFNNHGQLGDGTTVDKHTPIQIGSATDWAMVAVGDNNSFAIKTDGTLWAWGWNNYGQLGDGSTVDKHTPTRIGTDADWAMVASGWFHTLAIKTDGTLWAWGYNGDGQLGDGTTVDKHTPIQIGSATDWAMVAVGYNNSFAIKTDGTFWAWGRNNYGQLGDGTTVDRYTPTRIYSD